MARCRIHGREFEHWEGCPECRYITLRRTATRCPKCHAMVAASYWTPILERERQVAEERERQRQQAAEEWARGEPERQRKAKAEADARALEAQRLARGSTGLGWVVVVIALVVLGAFGVKWFESIPIEPQVQQTRGLHGSWLRSERAQDLLSTLTSCDEITPSARHEILCNGQRITPPLRYVEREPAREVLLSKVSPSGRFLLAAVCGLDWCDDLRLLDYGAGRCLAFHWENITT